MLRKWTLLILPFFGFCHATNLNNFKTSDVELLRSDRVDDSVLGAPSGGDVRFDSPYQTKFFGDETKNVENDATYINGAIRQEYVPTPLQPPCGHNYISLATENEYCASLNIVHHGWTISVNDIEKADDYCKSWGFDSALDNIDSAELKRVFDEFDFTTYQNSVIKLRQKPDGFGGLEYYFCGGACTDDDFLDSTKKVDLPPNYMNTMSPGTNTDYLVVFAVRNAFTHMLSTFTHSLSAGVICMKAPKIGFPDPLRLPMVLKKDSDNYNPVWEAGKDPRSGETISSNYYLTSRAHQGQGEANSIHELVLPVLPKFKKAKLLFNYICGLKTIKGSEKYCSVSVSHRLSSISEDFSTIPPSQPYEYFNDGTLTAQSLWHQQEVMLPPIQECGELVKIRAEYNPESGGFGLDNVKLATKDTCTPRWIEIPQRRLKDTIALQPTLASYEHSSVGYTKLNERHYVGTVGSAHLDYCKRLCMAGSACDIFELNKDTGNCRLMPHTTLKSWPWNAYTEAVTIPDSRISVYFLECTSVAQDISPHPDEYMYSADMTDTTLTTLPITMNDLAVNTMKADKVYRFELTSGGASVEGLKDYPNWPGIAPEEYHNQMSLSASVHAFVKLSGSSSFGIERGGTAQTYLKIADLNGFSFVNARVNIGDGAPVDLTFTMQGSGAVEMTQLEITVESPVYVGCFDDVDSAIDAGSKDPSEDQDAETCLVYCSQSGKRYAFLKRGSECFCADSIADSMKVSKEEVCSTACSLNPNQFCGDSKRYSVYVQHCPAGQHRFQGHCYFTETTPTDKALEQNQDFCASQGANVWWPDSLEEAGFVSLQFDLPNTATKLAHVGYRFINKNEGIQHSDYSMGTGVSYFTFTIPESLADGEYFAGGSSQCAVLSADGTVSLRSEASCPAALGICKKALAQGYGHKSLGASLVSSQVRVMSSDRILPPSDIVTSSPMPVHVELQSNLYALSRWVEVELREMVVISALKIVTLEGKALKRFKVQYEGLSILYPGEWSKFEHSGDVETEFKVFEGTAAANVITPGSNIIDRTVALPKPVETRYLRLEVVEADVSAAFKMDIVGMFATERYELNPFLDEQIVESVTSNQELLTGQVRIDSDDVIDSIKVRLLLGPKVSESEVCHVSLDDNKAESFRLIFEQNSDGSITTVKVSNGIGNSIPADSYSLAAHYKVEYMNPLEVSLRFSLSGMSVYINGIKLATFPELIKDGQLPSLALVRWTEDSAKQLHASEVVLYKKMEFGAAVDFGFDVPNTIRPYKFPELFTMDVPVIRISEENALLKLYGSVSLGEYGYIPFQLKQHCYHTAEGNVRCSPLSGGHNTVQSNINYGYGGGKEGFATSSCPSNFKYVGRVCMLETLNIELNYDSASKHCAGQGSTIYYSPTKEQNHIFKEVMEERFSALGSQTLWLGMKKINNEWVWDNGEKVAPASAFWADEQPAAGKSCAVADKSQGYMWRTVNCAEKHAFFCSIRKPNCPPGYDWSRTIASSGTPSRSCFKVTELGGTEGGTPGELINHVSVGEAACTKDGTRLSAPANQNMLNKLWEWMEGTSVYTWDDGNVLYYMGFRSSSLDDQFISSKDSSGPVSDLAFDNTTEHGCYVLKKPESRSNSTAPVEIIRSNCGETNTAGKNIHGVCHYEECLTNENTMCKFPFRYKGRLYDSCVSIENNGVPWCATQTDENNNYVGYFKICADDCLVNNCPVGFYRAYPDDTCYHVSSIHLAESTDSIEAARDKCRALGARLWEPRTRNSLAMVMGAELALSGHAATAIGLKVRVVDNLPKVFYYSDDTQMTTDMQTWLTWEPGHPDTSKDCVAVIAGKLQTTDCTGLTHLGYVCEARPGYLTSSPTKSCHFPFKHDGVTYDSCVANIDGIETENDPWCATDLDDSGVMKDGKFKQCIDEDKLAIDGGSEGKLCQFPFYMNEQYYETCTKHMFDAPEGVIDRYWCPAPGSIENTDTWNWMGGLNMTDKYGYCPDVVSPEQNGCADHYEAIGDFCYRVSAYPKDFASAEAKCNSEGSSLGHIPSKDVKEKLALFLEERAAKYNYFVGLTYFWLGAKPNYAANDWSWDAYEKPVSAYNNWRGKNMDEGCPVGGCDSSLHGLTMRASGSLDWIAQEKSKELPYICVSKCQRGFQWYEKIERCLRIVEESNTDEKRTIYGAMRSCEVYNGRLLTISTCNELDKLHEELLDLGFTTGERFSIGHFTGMSVNTEAPMRRRALSTHQDLDSYARLTKVEVDPSFCSSGAASSAASPEYVVVNLDADVATVTLPLDPSGGLDQIGYVCQQDVQWGCPEGYFKSLENCLKVVNISKTARDAVDYCASENSVLAKPQYTMDKYHLGDTILTKEAEWGIATTRYFTGLNEYDDSALYPYLSGVSDASDHPGPYDCIALEKTGDYMDYVKVACHQTYSFVCQQEQNLRKDLQLYVPDPVALLPMTEQTQEQDKSSSPPLKTKQFAVGYDTKMVEPLMFKGSANFPGLYSPEKSYIEVRLGDDFRRLAMTVALWMRATPTNQKRMTLIDFSDMADPELQKTAVFLEEGKPAISVTGNFGNEEKITFDVIVTNGNWHFVAFSFNSQTSKGILVLDELVMEFTLPGASLFSPLPAVVKPWIGAAKHDPTSAFLGQISCVQIMSGHMDDAQIKSRMDCIEADNYKELSRCPKEWHYFEGMCYQVLTSKLKFAAAEVACLGERDSPYKTTLAWSEKLLHLDYIATLVLAETGSANFWVGLDDRNENGVWVNSLGEDVDPSALDPGHHLQWAQDEPVSGYLCAYMNSTGIGGRLKSGLCSLKKHAVCSRAPLDAQPDNDCPGEYLFHKGACLKPQTKRATFMEAQVKCAEEGSIVHVPKGQSDYDFWRSFADSYIAADTWVGLTNSWAYGRFDSSKNVWNPGEMPLYIEPSNDWTYSDGNRFQDGDYKFGYDADFDLVGPCMYSKKASVFAVTKATCEKSYAFICRWQAVCDYGYVSKGPLSDGRTCYKIESDQTTGEGICRAGVPSDFIKPLVPTREDLVESMMMHDNEPFAWLSFTREFGPWEIDYTNGSFLDTSLSPPYEDMVDIEGYDWQAKVADLGKKNPTVPNSCLALNRNGLIQLYFNETCQESRGALCQYRPCFTVRGKQCQFPFTYRNFTLDGIKTEITYTSCASLDIFEPWCPTELDGSGDIVEWDLCHPDCAYEKPQSVCQEDPIFPKLITDEFDNVNENFTTDYVLGEGRISREYDYVRFTCPEGFYFNGTKAIDVYAFCHNGNWTEAFDPETFCAPVKCPCPRWFPDFTPVGTYDWDVHAPPVCTEQDTRDTSYLKVIEYTCPTGHVFDMSGMDVPLPESALLNLTCDKWSDWEPPIEPKCIPIKCDLEPPFEVNNTQIGHYDWVEGLSNNSYGAIVNYWCDIAGWGYPSTGENSATSICQANKKWSLESVEACVQLPCTDTPPAAPEGGTMVFDPDVVQYTCPNAMQFETEKHIEESECTPAREWYPEEMPACIPRQCPSDAPAHFDGMDKDWPLNSRDVGTLATYSCPLYWVTWGSRLNVQYSQCWWDEATDELYWYPKDVQPCNRE